MFRRSEQLGTRIAARDVENCLEDVVPSMKPWLRAMLVRQLANTGKRSDEIQAIITGRVRNKLQNVRCRRSLSGTGHC